MKKLVSVCAFMTVAGLSTSALAYWEPSFWRCQADPLGATGAPLPATYNLAKARREWSKAKMDASQYVPVGQKDLDYWNPKLDADVTTAWTTYQMELYPVYERKGGQYGTGLWAGPGPNVLTSDQRYATTYTALMNVSGNYGKPFHSKFSGLCEGGCYTPDQQIRFGLDLVPIGEAYKESRRDVTTLAPEATFDALSFMVNEVARYTVDKEAADQDILVFRMQSGGHLKVTLEHPLLTPDGTLRAAKSLAVGDNLVREDGSEDLITSIDQTKWFGKAYNLRPVTTDFTSNILVAQGYLNGSVRFQNEYVSYLNRVILRQNIPDEVLPE